jgi:prevent-host-death family protein
VTDKDASKVGAAIMPTKSVSATDFKAKCLTLIAEMNRTKIPIVVTKRGKPVAEIYPAHDEAEVAKLLFGSMKGTVLRYDDPFAPAIDPGEWDAMK